MNYVLFVLIVRTLEPYQVYSLREHNTLSKCLDCLISKVTGLTLHQISSDQIPGYMDQYIPWQYPPDPPWQYPPDPPWQYPPDPDWQPMLEIASFSPTEGAYPTLDQLDPTEGAYPELAYPRLDTPWLYPYGYPEDIPP